MDYMKFQMCSLFLFSVEKFWVYLDNLLSFDWIEFRETGEKTLIISFGTFRDHEIAID